jgi:tripartite-type tricarboxylate transporter receptor subunit TctC
MKTMLRYLLLLSGLIATILHAQPWPQKTIQIIVPFPAGGSSDVIARLIATRIQEGLKQSVIVDNRPGAGTLIGTQLVAKAAADGYTLLLADVPFTVNPLVLPPPTYDPNGDFTPITLVGVSAQFLYSNPARYSTLKDLIAAARAKPKQVTMATTGPGTTTQLMTEMLQSALGITFVQVPYKGSAPALADAAGGQVDAAFSTFASAAPFVNSGKLRVLGVTAAKRLSAFSDVPTFAEVGAPELDVQHWWGVLGPAGVPRDIVDRLQTEIAKALTNSEVRERLGALGVEPRSSTPAEFQRLIDNYVKRWAKIVRENNIKAN